MSLNLAAPNLPTLADLRDILIPKTPGPGSNEVMSKIKENAVVANERNSK